MVLGLVTGQLVLGESHERTNGTFLKAAPTLFLPFFFEMELPLCFPCCCLSITAMDVFFLCAFLFRGFHELFS